MTSSKSAFPFHLFGLAFAFSIVATLVGAALSWQIHLSVNQLVDKHITLTKSVGRIMLLDEALTNSARMAAATGDIRYEKRYDKLVPQLTTTIDGVRTLLPQKEMTDFVSETDAANTALVKMERQAFALTRQGRVQEATALLTGEEYSKLKADYAGGMRKTIDAADTLLESNTRKTRILLLTSVAASVLSVLIFLVVSLLAAKSARSWIEERGRAEEALRESEARFRSLTGMSSDFYWESDAEHRLTRRGSANTKESAVSVFQRGAHIGERRWEIPCLSPDEAGWQAHRVDLDAHRPFRHFELSRLGSDGIEHFISISGDPMFDAAGVFKGYRGVGTDITERKKSEEALKLFRALIDKSNDAIEVVDPDTFRFLDVNHAECMALGYSREEMLSKTVFDIDPTFDRAMSTEFVQSVRKSGSMVIERRHQRKDGSEFPVELSIAYIELDRKYMLTIARDITERKLGEEGLRAAAERFRGIVEQSIAGIYIIQDNKIAYANPRFAGIFGFGSADEPIGRDAASVIADNERAAVIANIRKWLKEGTRSISYSTIGLLKDGSTIDIGVHAARATYDGRPAIIGMVQDVTDKKRAEEQIQSYIQQLKTAFMSTVEVATTLSEMRDPYTAGHERRVSEIAAALGTVLGFDERRIEGLRVAGHLHDIGKITIPAEILSKPGKLSAIERQLIQGHARAGYDVLKNVEFPWPVADVALQHHERWDGSGYPQSLKGEAIMFDARVMAVADVIEAMSSHRPYRPGLGIDKALAEIERGSGTVYDPVVANACLKLFREKNYAIPA